MSDGSRLFGDSAVLGCCALLFYACTVERRAGHGAGGGASGAGNAGSPATAGGSINSGFGGRLASGGGSGGSAVARGGSTQGSGGDPVDSSAGSGGQPESDGGAASIGSGGESSAGTTSTGGAVAASGGGMTASAGTSGSGATNTACTTNPCKNGGACAPGSGAAYTCTCSNRFVGANCEYQRFMGVPIHVSAMSQDGTLLAGQSCDEGGSCSSAKVPSSGGAVTILNPPTTLPQGMMITNACEPSVVNGDGSWIGARCAINVGGGFAGVEWPSSSSAGSYMAGRTANETLIGIGGVSTDGSIVAGTLVAFTSSTTGVNQIFRRTTSSGVVALPPLNSGEWAGVNAVSNDGLLLVGSSGGHPFRWHPSSGMQALAELPNASPNQDQGYAPHDVSADGKVIVGAFATRGGPTALRWTSADVLSLGLGEVVGTNHDASLLVGSNPNGACAWDGSGSLKTMLEVVGTTPDATGWQLSSSVAISDDGKTIAGNGVKDGKYQSWVAHLP